MRRVSPYHARHAGRVSASLAWLVLVPPGFNSKLVFFPFFHQRMPLGCFSTETVAELGLYRAVKVLDMESVNT